VFFFFTFLQCSLHNVSTFLEFPLTRSSLPAMASAPVAVRMGQVQAD
jgi:hypothetical protein